MKNVPYERNEETAAVVNALSAYGVTHDEIALYIKVSKPTLYKYYGDELKLGKIKANTRIAEKLYEMAKAGDRTACIFWLKTRAGWRETSRMELANADDKSFMINTDYDLSKLSKEELIKLREILITAGANEEITDDTGNRQAAGDTEADRVEDSP